MIFKITYTYNNKPYKPMRIRNCTSELHAKMRLSDYLEKKHGNGDLVITSCYAEDGIFNMFGDIFKG